MPALDGGWWLVDGGCSLFSVRGSCGDEQQRPTSGQSQIANNDDDDPIPRITRVLLPIYMARDLLLLMDNRDGLWALGSGLWELGVGS